MYRSTQYGGKLIDTKRNIRDLYKTYVISKYVALYQGVTVLLPVWGRYWLGMWNKDYSGNHL